VDVGSNTTLIAREEAELVGGKRDEDKMIIQLIQQCPLWAISFLTLLLVSGDSIRIYSLIIIENRIILKNTTSIMIYFYLFEKNILIIGIIMQKHPPPLQNRFLCYSPRVLSSFW